MYKKEIISFILGVLITSVVMIFVPFRKETSAPDIKEFYDRLVSLDYAGEISEVPNNADFFWEKIKQIAEWSPKGDVTPEDVVKGKIFYSNSREPQLGTLLFNGSADEEDVVSGKTFFNDSNELKTGTWSFKGDAVAENVLSGKTFYSNSGKLLEGTLSIPSKTPDCKVSYTGNATAEDVLVGKTFYSNSGKLLEGSLSIPSVVPEAKVSYLGNASIEDVLNGKTFYSNSGILKTGTLAFPQVNYIGNATVNDVMNGKTFYSNSETLSTGEWSFNGTATAQDVLTGKTFYSNTSNLAIGSALAAVDYSLQQYCKFDDNKSDEYQGEESGWVFVDDGIWKDERTGLSWTDWRHMDIGFNNFDVSTCDLFTSIPRSSYDGSDVLCGSAINYCATLSLDNGMDDWYLPSQKELMQAYINGMTNQAGNTSLEATSFTAGYNIFSWSATESSGSPMYAWGVNLQTGLLGLFNKTDDMIDVRCVSRN